MVSRRGETPLVPPYRLRRPNKAMTLLRAGASLDSLTFLVAKCRPIHVAADTATRKLGKLDKDGMARAVRVIVLSVRVRW